METIDKPTNDRVTTRMAPVSAPPCSSTIGLEMSPIDSTRSNQSRARLPEKSEEQESEQLLTAARRPGRLGRPCAYGLFLPHESERTAR
jgi:hypothetical protein